MAQQRQGTGVDFAASMLVHEAVVEELLGFYLIANGVQMTGALLDRASGRARELLADLTADDAQRAQVQVAADARLAGLRATLASVDVPAGSTAPAAVKAADSAPDGPSEGL